MTSPRHRSRSLRRVFVKTPGSRVTIHYRKRKPSKAKCGSCGKVLSGVASERPFKMRNLGKSRKRPERAYGGTLCSACSRKKLTAKARSMFTPKGEQ